MNCRPLGVAVAAICRRLVAVGRVKQASFVFVRPHQCSAVVARGFCVANTDVSMSRRGARSKRGAPDDDSDGDGVVDLTADEPTAAATNTTSPRKRARRVSGCGSIVLVCKLTTCGVLLRLVLEVLEVEQEQQQRRQHRHPTMPQAPVLPKPRRTRNESTIATFHCLSRHHSKTSSCHEAGVLMTQSWWVMQACQSCCL